jgi:hypothetical protein
MRRTSLSRVPNPSKDDANATRRLMGYRRQRRGRKRGREREDGFAGKDSRSLSIPYPYLSLTPVLLSFF